MKPFKIGFSSGVFDMFHIGHLNYLERSKQLCDYLIVGVTTDDEVLRVKNKKTIIPFEERIKIVQSLKCVDLVVPENDVNKLVSHEKYQFDIIFKGSDWRGTELWNHYEKEFDVRDVEVVFYLIQKGYLLLF